MTASMGMVRLWFLFGVGRLCAEYYCCCVVACTTTTTSEKVVFVSSKSDSYIENVLNFARHGVFVVICITPEENQWRSLPLRMAFVS